MFKDKYILFINTFFCSNQSTPTVLAMTTTLCYSKISKQKQYKIVKHTWPNVWHIRGHKHYKITKKNEAMQMLRIDLLGGTTVVGW